MHVATITIDHLKVAGDLTDYVVAVINNSDAGWAELYATATSGGGDIRVYKAGGVTELPREIVSFSVVGETGEIHIKYTGTLSGSVDTDIEIHADGTSSDYAVTATYGRNAVWPDYYRVAHDGGASDSTGNGAGGSEVGGLSSGDSTGQVGSSTTYDGSEYVSLAYPADSQTGSSSRSHSAWVNVTSSGEIIRYGNAATKELWMIEVFTSSGGYIENPVYNATDISNTGIIPTSTWVLVHVVYDGSDVFFYADGSPEGSWTPGTINTINGFYDERIGSAGFTGELDEHRMHDGVLSSNCIKTEHDNQNSPTTFYSVAAISSGAVTVTPAAQVATFSLPAETVSTGTTVAANTQTATFSLPAESVIIATTATPAAQVATFSIPNFTIDAGGNITTVGGVNTATFSVPQESILLDFVTQPSAVTATFSTPATTIATGSGATVAPAVQVGTFSTPAPSISVEASVTVGVDTQLLTFSLPALQRVGGLWTKRPRATNADWSRRSVNDD